MSRDIHYGKAVVDNGVKLLIKALFHHLGQGVAVKLVGIIPAYISKQIVRALDYRRVVAVGHGDNVVVNHISNFVGVIDNKFLCPLPEIIKIIKHFVGGFKVKRGLIVEIVKALTRHKNFADNIIALFKEMHVPRGDYRLS